LLKLSRLLWVVLLVGAFVALGNGRAEATTGLASWYGPGLAGSPTASGDVFDPSSFTAAHKTLPFGTQLTVSYRGRSAQVTVNDRGPYTGGRDLDLSQGAAESLGLSRAGVDYVDYTVTGRGGYGARQAAGYGADEAAGYSGDSGSHRLALHRTAGQRLAVGRAATGGGSNYVVRPGDTLWDISAQLGTSVHRLASDNGIANPNVISVGQRIHY
jgi:rare lipoprotein A